MYASQLQALACDHRAIAVDSRGHGESEVPQSDWTMRDQGGDYARVMDGLNVDQAVVVGQSMGGMAALHLALEYPSRVRGLVLIDTSAGAEALFKRIKYRTLVLLARIFGMRPLLLHQAAKLMFGRTFRRTHPERVQQCMQPMAAMDPRAIARTLRPVVSRPSVVERLSGIDCPALVIVGAEDETTPPREAQLIVEKLPNARLETLAETGHMAPIERPEEITRLIRDFLGEIGW